MRGEASVKRCFLCSREIVEGTGEVYDRGQVHLQVVLEDGTVTEAHVQLQPKGDVHTACLEAENKKTRR